MLRIREVYPDLNSKYARNLKFSFNQYTIKQCGENELINYIADEKWEEMYAFKSFKYEGFRVKIEYLLLLKSSDKYLEYIKNKKKDGIKND